MNKGFGGIGAVTCKFLVVVVLVGLGLMFEDGGLKGEYGG